MSLSRFLQILEYPAYQTFDATNRIDLITLVIWLEDRKIRYLDIADRAPLRVNSPEWDSSFTSYLSQLQCPYDWPREDVRCLTWLVSHAIQAEYEDVADSYYQRTDSNVMDVDGGGGPVVMEDDRVAVTAPLEKLGEAVGVSRRSEEEEDAGTMNDSNTSLS